MSEAESIQRQRKAADRGNAEAARIILADPERHGGEGSIQVEWARLYQERKEKEENALQSRRSG